MQLIFKILAFVLLGAGAITVYAADWIVKKYELDKKAKCTIESELSEEEMAQYKFSRALLNCKMLGFLVMLPGIVLLLIFFK